MTSTSVYRAQANAARLASHRLEFVGNATTGFLHSHAPERHPLPQRRGPRLRLRSVAAFNHSTPTR